MTTWKGSDILSELMKKKVARIKASFSLHEPNYIIFRELCKSRGLGMSEVLDVAIHDFLVSVGELEKDE